MTVVYILLIVVIFLLLLILIRQNLYTRSRQNPQLDLQVKQLLEEQQRMEKRLQDANFQLSGSFNQANERVLERYGQFERVMRDQLNQHTSLVNQQLQSDFSKLNERIEFNLLRINDKVNERLDQSFNKTNETFQNILVRLAKIDEAQKKIESLSTDIVSLQNLLSDKKSRGTFGEVQLYQIMAAVFGEKNDRIYETQYKLSNGTIVDAMLHAPLPMGDLPIDSKFPLENYQRMMDRTLGEVERQLAEKQFKQDVKKHIDDIFNKYVTPQETSDQAVMFLPAEAIFAEINAYHPDLVAYSQRKEYGLVTYNFMSTLTTIQVILNNLERDQHALIIQQELNKLRIIQAL
ncbi:MAG: DNA recombination protein RmuC [Turicibacter sanguinis]